MQKIFHSFSELLEFDFSSLEPQQSNYLKLIPTDGVLPSIKEEFCPKKWHVVNHPNVKPQIVFEITPRWVTITIHGTKISKRENFEISKKDAKSIINGIFEL